MDDGTASSNPAEVQTTFAGEGSDVLIGVVVDGNQDVDEDDDTLATATDMENFNTWRSEQTDRFAATMVRRMTNQHKCQGTDEEPCRDPDHRRDVDYTRYVLSMLGLPGEYPNLTEQDYRDYLGAYSKARRPLTHKSKIKTPQAKAS